MTGIGSLVNAGAIIAGGLVGLTVGSFISKRVQATLVSGMAVGTLFIGAGSTFSKMLVSGEGGSLESRGTLMLVISLVSSLLRPIMTPEVLDAISLVGGVLIFCVGWNILWHEKKIRVANLLPALVVAVVWALVVTRGA